MMRLPEGVRHYNTQGFAESWEVYDALTPEDGWEERLFETPDERTHRSKHATRDGFKLIVYPPAD